MIAVRGPVASERWNTRPCRRGMPIALKKSSVIPETRAWGGPSFGAAGRPSTVKPRLMMYSVNGRQMAAAAACTPGAAASRSVVCWAMVDVLLHRPVLRAGQMDVGGHDAGGTEAGIFVLQPGEAAHQQPRPRQQHQGDGHLADHQGAAQALPAPARGRAAPALLQGFVQLHLRCLQRRRHPEANPGQQPQQDR